MIFLAGCTSQDPTFTLIDREISQSPPGAYGYYQDGDDEDMFFVVDSGTGGETECDLPSLNNVVVVGDSVDASDITWPQRGCADRGSVIFRVALAEKLPVDDVQLTFRIGPDTKCENAIVVRAHQPQLCDEDSIVDG